METDKPPRIHGFRPDSASLLRASFRHARAGDDRLARLHLSQRSTIGRVDEFVPRDFDVPRRLETPQFVLEPLGPEHNDQDYDAWTSSLDHIHATPGWEDSKWPREMTPDENRADLQRHTDDFRNRTGFTYTVLDPVSRDVIGCVYIYPLPDSDYDARALSWVRASHAQLDTPLWRAVNEWLASNWPFGSVEYAPRA
jgi:RimJ/RimL family protein N-acetyltransferase